MEDRQTDGHGQLLAFGGAMDSIIGVSKYISH